MKKTEQSILCPTNPYAATKAGAELIVQSTFNHLIFQLLLLEVIMAMVQINIMKN